ncbi:MAG TPA: hypothetical protein VHZ95_18590, partial [Polyangiales bacterium]|nr:hypothetical protein [Polyangiales bacterium]
ANGGSGGENVVFPPYGISPVPVYGAPVAGHVSPPLDAGAKDAGDVDDAGTPVDAGHMVHPLYGASPLPAYGAPIAGSHGRK